MSKPYWVQIELPSKADFTGFMQVDLNKVNLVIIKTKFDDYQIIAADFDYEGQRIGFEGKAAESFFQKWTDYQVLAEKDLQATDARNKPSIIMAGSNLSIVSE